MQIVGAISATDSLHLFSMVPLMGLTLPIPDHMTLKRKIDATSHRRMPASLVFDNVRLRHATQRVSGRNRETP